MSFLSNFRKTFFVYTISLSLVAGFLLLPQSSSAQTTNDLMAQIQALLAQVATLQAQLAVLGGGSGGGPGVSCFTPTYNLYLGHSDRETEGQVTGLQKFLARYPDIYPDALITGYFGPLTEQAVQRFQRKYEIVSGGSPDTTGYGVVGPATRAKIRELCGNILPPPPINIDASGRDSRRAADVVQLRVALEIYWDVNESYPVSLYALVPTFIASVPEDPLGNMYHYVPLPDNCGGIKTNACSSYHIGSSLETTAVYLQSDHDYNSTASPGGINGSDQGPCRPIGGGVVRYCYDLKYGTTVPPSSTPFIKVLSPNGGEVWKEGSVNNKISWQMPGDKIYDVSYYLIPQDPNAPRGTSVYFNTVVGGYDMGGGSTSTPTPIGSNSLWIPLGIPAGSYTLRMYLSNYPDTRAIPDRALAKDESDTPFNIVAPGSTNLPPTISGVSGPTALNVGQSGTWSVTARDPEQQLLKYSVLWGDEGSFAGPQFAPLESYTQTATFTHTYTRQGVFNPTFTVTDNGGLSERTSVSVNVGGALVPPLGLSIFIMEQNGRYTKINGGVSGTEGPMHWIWGDGTETDSYFPATHTYGIDGAYKITVQAKNSAGSISANVAVDAYEKLQMTLFDPGVNGTQVKINGVVTYPPGTVTPISWDWGDGTTDSQWFPASHTYNQGSRTYLIRATALTNDGKKITNTKTAVVPSPTAMPSITVLSPNGGESLVVGTTYRVQWQRSDATARTVIGIQPQTPTQGGALPAFTVIADNVPNTGTYDWMIQNYLDNNLVDRTTPILPGLYKLRISQTIGSSSYYDDSDDPFSITTNVQQGSWSVNQAPSIPTEKWVTGGSQNVVSNVLRFTAINEDMSLSSLRLQLRQPAQTNDVAKIHLYDGNTLIVSKVPSFISGVEDFTFPTTGAGSFIIPKDSYKEMTIKVDLPGIGSSQAGRAGQFVAVDFDGDGTALGKNIAVGRGSGTSIRTSTQTDVPSNGVRYFRSLPTISRLAIPVTTLYSGNNVLYKFQVSSTGYDVALRKVTFQTAIDGNNTVANVVLWNTTDNRRVAAVQPTVGSVIRIVADTTDYSSPYVIIPAGQARTFELRADITSLGVGNVSTKLLGDTQYPVLSTPMGTAAEVEASPSSNIIWSDFSADTYTTHSLTTKDWTNGFHISGMLPTGLDSSTLSGGGCCAPTIKVLSPNGGESWLKGTMHTITWTSNNISQVYIKLRKGNDTYPGTEGQVTGPVANAGSYNWTIPATLPDGNDYTIRVVNDSGTVIDDSDAAFTITTASQPDLTVSDIYDDMGKLSVKISNIGAATAPSNIGHLYIWIDDQLVWTYSLGTLANQSFLSPGGIIVVQPQTLSGSHKIKAFIDPNNVIAESNESNNVLEKTLTFVSVDTTPPSIPTNVSVTAQSTSQINLSWTASTDNVGVTGYRVERCQDSTIQGSAACINFVQVGTSSTNSYSNTGLAAGTTYRYRVRAADAAGNLSGYSSIVVGGTGTILPDTTPPSIPTNFNFTAYNTTGHGTSWTASVDPVVPGQLPSGVTGYRLERCVGSTCTNFVQIAAPTITSYTDSGLAASTNYRYRVRAVDAAGNLSGYSSIIARTTDPAALQPDTTPPSVPTSFTAVQQQGLTSIYLSWLASNDPTVTGQVTSGVTGYRLERCTGLNCTTYSQIVAPTITSYTDPGVPIGTATYISYNYRVRAADAAGNLSGYSYISVIVYPPDTTAPSTPTNLVAMTNYTSSVSISWTASTDNVGVVRYNIYRCKEVTEASTGITSCTDFPQVGQTTTTSYTDTNLISGSVYRYRVRAVDAAGNISPSGTISITTGSTTQPGGTAAASLSNQASFAAMASVLFSIQEQLNKITAALQSLVQQQNN